MSSRRPALAKLAVGLLLLASFPIAWALPANLATRGLTVCFFRTLTGEPCLFCGLTHAFGCAMHGQWTLASRYHPLWWLAALVVFLAGAASLIDATTGSNWLDRWSRPWRMNIWLMAVVLGVGTLLRASFFPLPH